VQELSCWNNVIRQIRTNFLSWKKLLQHKLPTLGSKTKKKGIWNIVCKANCQSLLWPFIHCLFCLSNYVLHYIFACVIFCLIQTTSTLPFILFCFSNFNIFYKLVYSLVGRSPITYMPCITRFWATMLYRLRWVASLTHVQLCTYKHAMWTKRCAIKRKQFFFARIIY